jgi:FAD/FMN-containing dehydrogenase
MLVDSLKEIVGPKGWATDEDKLEAHLTEWRNAVRGHTLIMVSPASTEEVSQVVKACASAGVAIVPQGGNTGMCAGAVPDESGNQVLLNLSRMNAIREVDPLNYSMVVDAGCVLADIQRAARAAERYFPLRLGAEESCQIGGNLSTNAGGLNVIRYGTARNLVLGLEVVLADGRIWNGLRSLRKDTSGYDLKQMFIGSEGTLGIITGAALRLFPDPGETTTVLVAISEAGAAVPLLANLRSALADQIEAFELIGAKAFDLVEKHIPDARIPFDQRHPWFVLIQASAAGAQEGLEMALATCLEDKLILDAIICKSEREADQFWQLRHSISEAERREGAGIKHDISVPISSMEEFLIRCEPKLAELFPGSEVIAFGHVGDGNLHYNVHLHHTPDDGPDAAIREQVSTCIYDLVAELGGSFSAEHGVGLLKRKYLQRYKGDVDLSLMRTLKSALDPDNLLNPGKVI